MKKYYNVRQLESTDCAAACLASVSLFYGLELTITKLRDVCGTDSKGTNVNGLLYASEKLNFEAKAVRISFNNLMREKIRLPLIAHGITKNGMTHYIVVYKINKNFLVVGDPASKNKKMKIKEFQNFYDGVCLLLQPNNDFVGGKTKTTGILYKFLKLLTPHKSLFISAIISSLVLTILGIFSNFFNQFLIDDILPYSLKNQLAIFCIGFLIISFINIMINAVRQHILVYLSQKIDIPLTLGYFKHIFSLPMNFFSSRKTGDILTRFQDAGTIKNIMSSIALTILIDVTLASIVGVILYFMNSKLFVIILILTIINVILVCIFKKPFRKINLIRMEQNAKMSSSMIESLQSVEMIKTNAIEEDRMEIIENNYIDVLKTSFKENVLSNAQGTISSAVSIIGNLIIMWVGSILVMDGNITLGALMSFTSMTSFFMEPIGRLVGLQLQIQESQISMKRLSEIYDVEPEKIDRKPEVKPLIGDVSINNLTFSYTTRKPVLNNVNFCIKQGTKVAIVGESGSGKTTLSKLLFGLYDINEGNITIGERDIKDIGLFNLRKRISYVSQNINFFSGTVRDNIKAVNSTISDEKIKAIFKISGCDFILKYPLGIDTYLEEAGNNLSGGERQRLAFARALAKDFDILVLDEATSNLDFLSEMKIYNTLFNSSYNQTMIMIAHRLSTIRKCDDIIVLDNGQIVETGTHDALLEKKGKYYKLWMSQIGEVKDYQINKVEMKYE
ncbi:MAG: peptidase domain-containing ABC transporter [Anaeroplasma sp.]